MVCSAPGRCWGWGCGVGFCEGAWTGGGGYEALVVMEPGWACVKDVERGWGWRPGRRVVDGGGGRGRGAEEGF